MSKIYEALRQHEQQSSQSTVATSSPPLLEQLSSTNRDMQTLYRSVDAALAGNRGGAMIMFSSAHAGEGKTTVCGSFAETLAQNFGRSVLILDGDRQHSLSHRFGRQENATVTFLEQSPESVLQGAKRFGTRGAIAVVPIASLVGLANADSPELELIGKIKEKLASIFDYILLDSPAIADVSWTASIGRIADGVILVIEAERTRWPVALNAKQQFENSGARVLGVFLNKRRFYIPAKIYRYL